eukprot:9469072-Alexandrium_andersonii.AAC.1
MAMDCTWTATQAWVGALHPETMEGKAKHDDPHSTRRTQLGGRTEYLSLAQPVAPTRDRRVTPHSPSGTYLL